MVRPSRDGKVELKKGPWTREEDQKLLAFIQEHGHGSWRSLPAKAGLERCGKSCRLRWTNYLRPDIKRGKFSSHEEKTIIRLHALLGNRWSAIAAYLPKRTDNEIKNYWNTRLKKRLTRMGIDPSTHKPKSNSSLTHTAQWEATRLEAEARLGRGSNTLHLFQTKLTSRRPLHSPQLPVLPCLDVLKVWQANNAAGAANLNPIGSPIPASETSPTSTLNFSTKQNPTVLVPGVSMVANSVASVEDVTDNSWLMTRDYCDDHGCPVDNSDCQATDSADFTESYWLNGENGIGLEDTKNYWSELLNLVGSSSPLETLWTF